MCFVKVDITPEVNSRKTRKAIIAELVRLHQNTELGKKLPVYDGAKSLYTAGLLPFEHKAFNIVLSEDDEGTCSTRWLIIQEINRLNFLLDFEMSCKFCQEKRIWSCNQVCSSC